MLVNHLAKRHPDIPPDSVPELNLPILKVNWIEFFKTNEWLMFSQL
jgi:hypothetical protein